MRTFAPQTMPGRLVFCALSLCIAGAPSPAARASVEPATTLDAATVNRLAPVYAFRTDRVGAESSPPAYADGTLYLLTPFPHTLYAIDPISKRVRWQYAPVADRLAEGLACCDRSRHGPALAAGRVTFTTQDGQVVALDTEGKLRWSARVADPSRGESLSGAPTLAGGKVFVGLGGDDNGSRGALIALDADTGQKVWTRYSTGPDAEVGIDAAFKPLHAADDGHDQGTTTWPAAAWQQGGGGVAGPILVDSAAGLLLHETGHPAPWNPDQRTGSNRFTGGLFARDAATGNARWFVAFNSGDPFGYREGADVAVDGTWQGRSRALLVHADANGYVYVLARSSGEILGADPYVASVVAGVDGPSGETRYEPSQLTKVAHQTRNVCPAWTGAIGTAATRVPGTQLVLLPVDKLCMDIEPRPANYIKGTPYLGANVRMVVPQVAGGIVAWDVQARRPAWQADERFPVLGAALVVADLVFYGTLDGRLKALDARSGKLLWSFDLPSGVIGEPIAFRGTDGRPYLAVVTGASRIRGISRTEALDPRDPSAGLGLSKLMAMLPEEKDPAGTLLVFGLP
jgi:PQQ-dependent dehydrogenase (methanol/ethanol family)